MNLVKKLHAITKYLKCGDYLAIIGALLDNLKWVGLDFQAFEFYVCSELKYTASVKFPGFSQRSLAADGIYAIVPLRNKPQELSDQRYRDFLKRIEEYGDECRGIYYRDMLTGYAWLSNTKFRFPELEYERDLNSNEVYLYDGYISEASQNLGFYGLFLLSLVKEMSLKGKSIVNTIEFSNYKSRQAHVKVGFTPVGWRINLRCGKVLKLKYGNI